MLAPATCVPAAEGPPPPPPPSASADAVATPPTDPAQADPPTHGTARARVRAAIEGVVEASCDPTVAVDDAAPTTSSEPLDIDGDGEAEHLIKVDCLDVSYVAILGGASRRYLRLLEAYRADVQIVRHPSGTHVVLVEHDCCGAYELAAHTLALGAWNMKQTFAYAGASGACGEEDGFRARITIEHGRLIRIETPVERCSANGWDVVDLRTLAAP